MTSRPVHRQLCGHKCCINLHDYREIELYFGGRTTTRLDSAVPALSLDQSGSSAILERRGGRPTAHNRAERDPPLSGVLSNAGQSWSNSRNKAAARVARFLACSPAAAPRGRGATTERRSPGHVIYSYPLLVAIAISHSVSYLVFLVSIPTQLRLTINHDDPILHS